MQFSYEVGNGVVTHHHSSWMPAPNWFYWDTPAQEYRGPYSDEILAVAVGAHASEAALEG